MAYASLIRYMSHVPQEEIERETEPSKNIRMLSTGLKASSESETEKLGGESEKG